MCTPLLELCSVLVGLEHGYLVRLFEGSTKYGNLGKRVSFLAELSKTD